MQGEKGSSTNNRVLVIGAGVGGMRAALDLAEAGRAVLLIDKAYSIGGLMTQLDRTFPTNNCDVCTLSPSLSESGRELPIDLMTSTEVVELKGDAGDFKVRLTTMPRYIDLEKCTACGDCLASFPECVRFTPGLDPRAPTCMRYPQATPFAFSIDMSRCRDIQELVQVCKAGAIIPDEKAISREVSVGSIVVAPGAQLFDPGNLDTYGYGTFPNVVTSMEYERILSASGPTKGELLRPSDSKRPRKIAWIQCVGSRGLQAGANPYCSSACCMYALKEAIVTKERFFNDIETTIFFMDMRTSGKDYELYYQRARNDLGIRFVRSRPHTVDQDAETRNLYISYMPLGENALREESFDMVVLSTGFQISSDMQELAERLGIKLNKDNFVEGDRFSHVATSRRGIYACGLFESPKDIPETMVQASAAACNASVHLDPSGRIPEAREAFPPERDVSKEEPRIGVFVCDCEFNIGGIVDVNDVVKSFEKVPQVVVSRMIGHGCSRESLDLVRQAIEENSLNRVVVGACSPRTHEPLFQDTLRRAGLNKYLLEMANIRDQGTWVHMDRPAEAVEKVKELLRMAVSRVRLARPLADHIVPMNRGVLVVGGGVSGMTAAVSLADLGFRVTLAEKTGQLGGVAKIISRTLEGADVRSWLESLVQKTASHGNIEVLTHCSVVDHCGTAGMFTTGLQVGSDYRKIDHGITILATGAIPNRPDEYLLGKHEAVMTQLDLDGLLEKNASAVRGWKNVVMIQCVGSRVPENPNCSRICCQAAVKNALRILDINPDAMVYVLYRDMRTYGLQEEYYTKARERGVVFVQYEPDQKPSVQSNGNGRLKVRFGDPILGRDLILDADCLALSTGFIANQETTDQLASVFHLPKTNDSYFLEAHVKLRPIDMSVPGFFVAGTAHAPKTIAESVAQAQAAAGRALTLLATETINLGASVAQVDRAKCAACLICVRACPFEVPYINPEGYSEIDPAKCQGCGVCASECPAKAIQLMQYEDDQIIAELEGLFERV